MRGILVFGFGFLMLELVVLDAGFLALSLSFAVLKGRKGGVAEEGGYL